MDHYSILDENSSSNAPQLLPTDGSILQSFRGRDLREPLRFPGDDGGQSLREMAARDLEATLQLLVERARSITDASGAAIALGVGEEMICRASAGSSAPGIGAHLAVSSGLSGESVRTRQILRCDDASVDPRANRQTCGSLGIVSALVMPLIREQQVMGVFELLSGRAQAFQDRDVAALERLGEMIQTAVEHAEAANLALGEIVEAKLPVEQDNVNPTAVALPTLPTTLRETDGPGSLLTAGEDQCAEEIIQPSLLVERGGIGKCEMCAFPISEGRRLCLDCETSRAPESHSLASHESSAFQLPPDGQESWLQSHKYLIGTVAAAMITAAIVFFLR